MAKPEWGVKRTCQSCGARFYDMTRSPIICPKCGSVVEPEVVFKSSRRSSVPAEPKVVPVVLDEEPILDEEAEELETAEDEEASTPAAEESEEEEADIIEDASDLGEDDDDMAEVMDHIDEDLEDGI